MTKHTNIAAQTGIWIGPLTISLTDRTPTRYLVIGGEFSIQGTGGSDALYVQARNSSRWNQGPVSRDMHVSSCIVRHLGVVYGSPARLASGAYSPVWTFCFANLPTKAPSG